MSDPNTPPAPENPEQGEALVEETTVVEEVTESTGAPDAESVAVVESVADESGDEAVVADAVAVVAPPAEAAVVAAAAPAPAVASYCRGCGGPLVATAAVCPKCGTPTGNLSGVAGASDKSRMVAALLCFFIGVLGVHRFYVGKVGTGILMILTLGGLGIWTLIDFIVILVGAFRDKQGRPLINWS